MPLFTLADAAVAEASTAPPRRRPPAPPPPAMPKELDEEEEEEEEDALLPICDDADDDVSVERSRIPGSLIAVSAAITASSTLPDNSNAALRSR